MTPAIFASGDLCGHEYQIELRVASSPVTESYLAIHVETRKRVWLTCSRFEHRSDTPRSSSSFLGTICRLRRVATRHAPKVLDGGIDGPVYWVACEVVDHAVLLTDFIRGAPIDTPELADIRTRLVEDPHGTVAAIALYVGIAVAEALKQLADHGILYSGLDPRTSIALRGNGDIVVLEPGYQALFGPSYHLPSVEGFDSRAPEVKVGGEPDLRSDVYALGLAMGGLLSHAGKSEKAAHPAALVEIINKALEADPADRFQDWASVVDALKPIQEEAWNQLLGEINRGRAPGGASTSDASIGAPASGTRKIATASEPRSVQPMAPIGDDIVLAESTSPAPPSPANLCAPLPLPDESVDTDPCLPPIVAPVAEDQLPSPRVLTPLNAAVNGGAPPSFRDVAPAAHAPSLNAALDGGAPPSGPALASTASGTLIANVRPPAAPEAPDRSQQPPRPLKASSLRSWAATKLAFGAVGLFMGVVGTSGLMFYGANSVKPVSRSDILSLRSIGLEAPGFRLHGK